MTAPIPLPKLAPSTVFGLAPMEGVSDLPFRLWVSQTSAPDFTCTPFLRATDTFPRTIDPSFAPELGEVRDFVPYNLWPQVMSSRTEDFIRTAKCFLTLGAPFVDLNAGCPSPHPIRGGAGSGLLQKPKDFHHFLETVSAALPPHKVSVKLRIGFTDETEWPELFSGIRHLPLHHATIHGRTRRDRYDAWSRWPLIHAAATTANYPIVGSGDIVSHAAWQRRRELSPHIATLIVARGALRNPWIFTELRQGYPVSLDRQTLEYSLACLGILMETFLQTPERLTTWIRSGYFRHVRGQSSEAWQDLFCQLTGSGHCPHSQLRDLHFERRTMGRLKMIWNSLRSSLPACFADPLLLRATAWGNWLTAWEQCLPSDAPFLLQHQEHWDWLYTSSRNRTLSQTSEGEVANA